MAFSIRNAKVEEKARAYAAREGTTLTGALERALDKALAEQEPRRNAQGLTFEEWYAPIREMQRQAALSPDSGLTEDEILGYDENGVST